MIQYYQSNFWTQVTRRDIRHTAREDSRRFGTRQVLPILIIPRRNPMPVWMQTAALLSLSNIFMTFAWYGHLKSLNGKPWIIAALISWGIALFEYLIMVPANRIGYSELSVGQLKIMQEVITLSIFVPFSVLHMQQPLKLDYLWAGLCLLGAVYFIFRSA